MGDRFHYFPERGVYKWDEDEFRREDVLDVFANGPFKDPEDNSGFKGFYYVSVRLKDGTVYDLDGWPHEEVGDGLEESLSLWRSCLLGTNDYEDLHQQNKNVENDSVYNIPAKPVFYHGIKFRSKLEARWAVVWDVFKFEWEYEPERFIGLDGIDYDPDFYLPEFDVYGEVKGKNEQLFASKERISAAIDFQATPVGKSKGLLLLGQIPYSKVWETNYAVHGNYLFWDEGVNLGDFYLYSPREYFKSPLLLEETGLGDRGDFYAGPMIPEQSSVDSYVVNFPESNTGLLHKALKYARSAHFDFDDNLEKMFREKRNIIGGK